MARESDAVELCPLHRACVQVRRSAVVRSLGMAHIASMRFLMERIDRRLARIETKSGAERVTIRVTKEHPVNE